MNLTAPTINGRKYVFYSGADALDAFPDASGWMWFGDNMYDPQNKGATFRFYLCRQKDNVVEVIPLPEIINGAGRLNWTPAGLYVSGGYQADPTQPVIAKVFKIDQFNNNWPTVSNTTTAFTPQHLPISPARWVGAETNEWVVTDKLIRDKFRLSDTLLNEVRDILIRHGLAAGS